MENVRLTEKLIRETNNPSGIKPIILADTEIRGLQVHIYKFSKTYRLVKQINGKRFNIKIGEVTQMKLTDIKTHALTLITEIGNNLPPSGMLLKDSCVEILIPRCEIIGKDKNILGIIKNFLIRFFGEMKISELTPLMIQNMIYKLMAQDMKPETIRKRILVGKMLFRQLIKHNLIHTNPFMGLDLPKVSNIRTVVLTHEQRHPFLQCCLEENSVYADLLYLLLVSGLRVSEATRIRLQDINIDQTTLTLPETKARVVQYISLNSLAREVLHRRSGLTWNQYLFPSTVNQNKPIASPKGCFLRIKVRMKAIGHDIDNLHIHDLRRSFASACAEVTNGDMHMVASQLRHCSTNILKRYVHYQPNNIAIASEATAQALISPIQTQQDLEVKS